MKIHHRLLALLAGLSIMAAVAAPAQANGSFAAAFGSAQGLAGSIVHPTISLPIDGFDFDSMQFELGYDPNALAFLPGQTSLFYNGSSRSLTSMTNYTAGVASVAGNQLSQVFGFFALTGEPVTGPLLLTTAFQILAPAPLGTLPIQVSGTVSTDPNTIFGEAEFAGAMAVTVTAVPEPEIWLLLISGFAWVAARSRRTAARGTPMMTGVAPLPDRI